MTTTLPNNSRPAAQIDAAELHRMRDDNRDLRIVDVRTGGEFETVHIPGSVCIPVDQLRKNAEHVAGLEQPLVLICQSGARASQACEALIEAGAQDLHILADGVAAWQAAGLPVNRSEKQRWPMERQVRLTAGTIALSGVLASVFFPPAKWLAGFIGGGLTFSAVSNTCGMAAVLSKLPYNRVENDDFQTAMAKLERSQP